LLLEINRKYEEEIGEGELSAKERRAFYLSVISQFNEANGRSLRELLKVLLGLPNEMSYMTFSPKDMRTKFFSE